MVQRQPIDEETVGRFTDLAETEVRGFTDLMKRSRRGDAAMPLWRSATAELNRDSETWEMHCGPAFAAFSMHAAVAWIGLRCALMAGATEAEVRGVLVGTGFAPGAPSGNAHSTESPLRQSGRQALAAAQRGWQFSTPFARRWGAAAVRAALKVGAQTWSALRAWKAKQDATTAARATALKRATGERLRDDVARTGAAAEQVVRTASERVADIEPKAKLDGRSLRGSVLPTWMLLVVLSWFALAWGTLISLPFGVGLGLAATFLAGVVAVPLWGTVFGFLGMGAARDSTLRHMGFVEVQGPHIVTTTTARFAQALDIPTPRVGIIHAYNAFAMGYSHRDATIAIGKPLIERLTPAELAAVIGHELGHVVSGDMRKMMLMRTFQNATVWFGLTQGLKQFARWVVCWAAELAILAFSRKREYWADAIGAALAGKEAMIGALRKLADAPALTSSEYRHARFMFRGRVFSTHPSTKQRIDALNNETYLRRLTNQ